MAGYDKSIFLDLKEDIAEEYTCGICLGIIRSPKVVNCCLITFCGYCIYTWISNAQNCPLCSGALTENDLSPSPHAIINLIERQTVYCKHQSDGCTDTHKISEQEIHLKVCRFEPSNSCKYCGDIDCGLNGSECFEAYKQLSERLTNTNIELRTTNIELLAKIKSQTTEIDDLKVVKSRLNKELREKDLHLRQNEQNLSDKAFVIKRKKEIIRELEEKIKRQKS